MVCFYVGDKQNILIQNVYSKKVRCPDDDEERHHGFTSSGGKYKDEKWVKEKLQPIVDEIKAFLESVLK